MTWFAYEFEVHTVSNSKVSSPRKTPFAKDAHDLTIQRRPHALTVRRSVDVKCATPRMSRDISEIIGESTNAPLKTASVPIRVAHINCLSKTGLEDFCECTL